MSKKYETLAQQIIEKVGGEKNVSSLSHCQTRLRFILNDDKKADKDGMKKLEGVANVIESGGQFQVIVGTHVEEVHEEIIKHSSISNNEEAPAAETKKPNALNRVIDFISATFSPVIPAITGAGMIKAFLALLLLFDLISKESQTYYIINFMADAVFYFLPFFLAYSGAQKLKASPFLAMFLAGILLHPSFIQLKTDGDDVHLFGLPVRLVTYSSSVIPILLIVFFQSYIERFLKKIIPNAIKIIFIPMFTILITGTLALTIIGPLGSYIGDYIAIGFDWLASYGNWMVIIIVATLWPILVMFGIHYSISPLSQMQLATTGLENIIGPGALLSNISQGVAALIVSFKVKNSAQKQIATSTGITALMGVTEPALYGINLPKRYPLVAAMIGSACGGVYAGFTNVFRYATGASGIPAIPLYIGENIWNLYNILIALVITIAVTAILTYILSIKYEKNAEAQATASVVAKKTDQMQPALQDSLITSPLKGALVPLTDIVDEAFSSEALGKGIAIEPSEGKVVAPFNGTITAVARTKHAIGIQSDDGVEVLIHVGINTVKLKGAHFETFVEEGQKVTLGQQLLLFDVAKIKEAGFITQVPVIVTNTTDYSSVTVTTNTSVDFNDSLITVIK
ncbi:beta-glucoside-specific PTS transporter subunit IIABC [Paenibacillus donghaensis]|uniref:PTS beta-glucoside transporter subunit EIIBCA n=1 Tax=Paenibacillus donghaensis TaxID=414771 RepID=A0A2Z2KAF3_9BACL|nr:beta-glucoside-specific PTS transporter subunit IIABC [Paenibacillus donghaensis]ASA19773.1 PTS beta-glucoside transporter subunit EIIBCA [Paenibacillus donghaensis]